LYFFIFHQIDGNEPVYEEEGPKRISKQASPSKSGENTPQGPSRKTSQVSPAIKLDIIDETGGKTFVLIF
jgi:hypothetical protein